MFTLNSLVARIKKVSRLEVLLLVLVMLVYIGLRSWHFAQVVNFSTDQANFSLAALSAYQTKHLPLIGPTFSFNFNGRYAFQGPAIYYLQLVWLLLGGFEPVRSSYMFMVFGALMIWPLFYGVKWLINQKVAWLIVSMFSFLPYYLDYSRFLWNPNYQLILLPGLIFLTAIWRRKKTWPWLLLVVIYLGVELQFHYQFFLILIGYFIYFFGWQKLPKKQILVWLGGVAIGFSPLILFELRHQFYNTQTIWLMIQAHLIPGQAATSAPGVGFSPHYILSISFMMLLLISGWLKPYLTKRIVGLTSLILLIGAIIYCAPTPTHAFGAPPGWNYLKEQQVFDLITAQHIDKYAILNLSYDSLASVQKYLHAKNSLEVNINDYASEKYLFVIGTPVQLADTQAYEFKTFTPSTLKQTWSLGDNYQLYLFSRVN